MTFLKSKIKKRWSLKIIFLRYYEIASFDNVQSWTKNWGQIHENKQNMEWFAADLLLFLPKSVRIWL